MNIFLLFFIVLLISATLSLISRVKQLESLIDRVKRLEKSRQYRLTRIYNQEGHEVINKWTDQLSEGHWVTITTDLINHKVLFAEHSRTDENTNSVGRENCIREEHEYNRTAVWGDHYKRPLVIKKRSLKFRKQSIGT